MNFVISSSQPRFPQEQSSTSRTFCVLVGLRNGKLKSGQKMGQNTTKSLQARQESSSKSITMGNFLATAGTLLRLVPAMGILEGLCSSESLTQRPKSGNTSSQVKIFNPISYIIFFHWLLWGGGFCPPL